MIKIQAELINEEKGIIKCSEIQMCGYASTLLVELVSINAIVLKKLFKEPQELSEHVEKLHKMISMELELPKNE